MSETDVYKFAIPATWEIEVSSEVLDIRDGTHDTPIYVEKGGIPLITSKNLKNGIIDFENVNFISNADHNEISKRSQVEKGDILFAMIGTIGNPVVIEDCEVFSIKNVGLFRKNDDVLLPQLLCHFLSSKTFDKQLQERKLLKGTTQKFIPLGSLRDIILPIPPLPEQQRIVAKIEELFSSLDKGIENLKTAQQQLEVYRQAVLKWAFEGKLTNKNVVDGELPEGWKWVSFSELLCGAQNGISKRSSKDGTDYKVLRLSDITLLNIDYKSPRHIRLLEHEVDKYKLCDGDLVCIRVNGSKDLVGRLILIKERDDRNNWAFCDHFIRFALEPTIAIAALYFFYFQLTIVRKYIQENMVFSAGQNTVSQGIIKSVVVPLPPLPEQDAIVAEIESRLSVCDKIEESIEGSLKQAESLRQSILKKAFEGRLVPQDPNDEPASVLLGRIKAEREKKKTVTPQPRQSRKEKTTS